MANNSNRKKKVYKNGDSIKIIKTETQDTEIVDVSLRAFIRNLKVHFKAEGLKPSTNVHFFFDDVLVDDYIVKPRTLTLTQTDANTQLNQGFVDTDTLQWGSNTGYVLQTSALVRSNDVGNTSPRIRIVSVVDDDDADFEVGRTFTASVSANSATLANISITGGQRTQSWFQNTSDNTIRLTAATKRIANNYWGTDSSNTITLIPTQRRKKARAVKAHITGFNNVTQQLSLANTYATIRAQFPRTLTPALQNTGKKIGWQIHPSTGAEFKTDAAGKISGTFYIPAGMFRVGDRIFRIIDNLQNDIDEDTCFTRAEYRFTAYGLNIKTQETVLRNVNKENRESDPVTTPIWADHGAGSDPIAQTFYVSPQEFPNGIFLSAVDLFFAAKDPLLPVTVQIRPTVNGYPHSYEVVEGSIRTLTPDAVQVSTTGATPTKFKFQQLLYLPPGEYALVVKTDSNAYTTYVAELGAKILGTTRLVSEQPYMGSFFKSQNASTWDAVQMEDMKFTLYRANFADEATVYMGNIEPLDEDDPASMYADALYSEVWDDVLPNTEITYAHSFDSGATYVDYIPGTSVVPSDGRLTLANTSNGQYRVRATLTTSNPAISPLIYPYSAKLFTIKNDIDDATIDQDDIVITNGGSGYEVGANIELLLTSDSGSGAVLYAVANASGIIDNVYIGSAGSKYLGDISLLSANGNVSSVIVAANGNDATIEINHETGAAGGPAASKQISQTVTLAEGFEAGDLRLWITAYKPAGTDIALYYKVKNPNDSENFEDKEYVRMNQKTLSTLYSIEEDFGDAIEFEFEPADTTSAITYSTETGTYNTFNQFAIKIVLTSTDTTKFPIVYDGRYVAVPGPDLG